MNVVCIIQARTTSSRLPNKVLLKLPFNGEKTVLEQVIERVKRAKLISNIVVATTINRTDDKIEDLCKKLAIKCYRGSEENVLSRYYEAASISKADIVVRITSDCPCIDPQILDELIKFHIESKNDFSSNNQVHTYPHGLDAEIVNYNCLVEAYQNASENYEIEHVMPYFYKSFPEKYKIGTLKDSEYNHNIRITLDTKEDYSLLCLVYDYLYDEKKLFTKDDIVKLFKQKSFLYEINKTIEQKVVCKTLEEEIIVAEKLLNKQDLKKAAVYLKREYRNKNV